jgi:thiol-disulfide isomerase/thioredoxin
MKRFYLLGFFFSFSFLLKATDSIVVYIFMLDDCPITQSYSLKLNELYQEYGDQFSFIGIFPNASSKKNKIDQFVIDYQISFPTQTDYSKKRVVQFGVKITPEVVVYNTEKDEIIYKGRIDNEFADLGKRRKVVTTGELKEVLNYLSSGKEKVFPFTEAVGCFINQNDLIKN